MRCLRRNMVPFWYALYGGRAPILDENGDDTGQYEVRYGDPIRAYGNISAAAGDVSTRPFGDSLDYDKVIAYEHADTPIDEHAVLWIDTQPECSEDGSLVVDENGEAATPWDYVVRKVARSLNSVLIAVSKVNVGG